MSFTEKLDEKSLERFNVESKKPFGDQAQFFLNAFWEEVGDQAEFIYEVAYEILKKADMRWKNVQYIHLYDDGDDVDFDCAIYLFEQINKFCEQDENKEWKDQYPNSVPEMKTSIVRKKEIREKVDVNFDGRISFLEYLLYQYNVSPKDLMDRSVVVNEGPVNQALINARKALDDVNKKIREYEILRQRLTEEANGPGIIKSNKAKHELAILDSSPLAETLRKLLITAEAAVRIAAKQGGSNVDSSTEQSAPKTQGAIWWLQKEVAVKKAKYGPKK